MHYPWMISNDPRVHLKRGRGGGYDYRHVVLEPGVPMPHLRRVRLLLHLPPSSHGLTPRACSAGRAAARAEMLRAGARNGGREALRLYEAC